MREVNVSSEIRFRTARSGGKGGQHVNKVETLVEGLFDPAQSRLLDDAEKALVRQKLGARISRDGLLHVRSQVARTQLENKHRVVDKINRLLAAALIPDTPRKPTKPSRAAKEKRLQVKKRVSEKKENRRKDWE